MTTVVIHEETPVNVILPEVEDEDDFRLLEDGDFRPLENEDFRLLE